MDLQKFLVNIHNKLDGNTVGWGAAIYQGSQLILSGSGGYAVLVPPTKMSSTRRMDVMSMSKTISAAAVVALLPWKSLTIDSPIAPHLPKSWRRGPNVDKITFRMLMTHTSGLHAQGKHPGSATYLSLKKMIGTGIAGSAPTVVNYLNEGYSLLRIVLPYLWHGSDTMDYLDAQSPGSFPQYVAHEYVSLCKAWIVTAPSLKEVGVTPTGPQPFTRFYNFQNKIQSSASGTLNDAMFAGADFWNMSAREYGRVIVDLRKGTYVGGPVCWNTMATSRASNAGSLPPYPNGDARLGIWRFEGKHGEYYGHNGAYAVGAANAVGAFSGWMAFPNDITAAFVANSNLWFGYEQELMLMDAYDEAF